MMIGHLAVNTIEFVCMQRGRPTDILRVTRLSVFVYTHEVALNHGPVGTVVLFRVMTRDR